MGQRRYAYNNSKLLASGTSSWPRLSPSDGSSGKRARKKATRSCFSGKFFFFFFIYLTNGVKKVKSGVQSLRTMNRVHDAMRISTFLNLLEEFVVDDDDDILADIVLAHSVDEPQAYETDEESL